jgi:hypothetical protein
LHRHLVGDVRPARAQRLLVHRTRSVNVAGTSIVTCMRIVRFEATSTKGLFAIRGARCANV